MSYPRRAVAFALTAIAAVMVAMLTPAMAQADNLTRYLNLPLVNRDAAHGPGGVHPNLPTDAGTLASLLKQARAQGITPSSYKALLYQYWLVRATNAAGINLTSWNPRTGPIANRQNLIRSYRYYEDLQLAHHELQWSGMAGMVGADFGGGMIDFETFAGTTMNVRELQQAANAVVKGVSDAAGPAAINSLPRGLRAIASGGAKITGADINYILGMIMVMQKNIFSDLMPMHTAYVAEGIAPLTEMRDAGLFGAETYNAWLDVASGDKDRIATGNGLLLKREQGQIIKEQWDHVRNYRSSVGEAVTYLATVAGSPSVAGVVPPRAIDPVIIESTAPTGQRVRVTTFLPDWNWSVYEARWSYITRQLLPKYKDQVNNNWPTLRAQLQVPYETQLETHRPIMNIPQMLYSIATQIKVEAI